MTTFSKSKVPNAASAWAQLPRRPQQQGRAWRHRRLRTRPAGRGRPARQRRSSSTGCSTTTTTGGTRTRPTGKSRWSISVDDDQPGRGGVLESPERDVAAVGCSRGRGSDQTHPTIYVARGSHAMYFNVAGGVHYAVLRQPWAVFDFSGQLLVKGSKDAVGEATEAPATYRLEVMPVDPEQDVDERGRRELGAAGGGSVSRAAGASVTGSCRRRSRRTSCGGTGPSNGPATTAPPTRAAGMKSMPRHPRRRAGAGR